MENTLLSTMIENEVKNRGLRDFVIEDHVEMFSSNSFTLGKNTNEVVFVYSQNYFVNGGSYAGDIDVVLISDPAHKSYPYATMENNFIKNIFKAQSNIDVKITCPATVTSIIRYVKLIPITNQQTTTQ